MSAPRIAVIDDEGNLRAALESGLRTRGFEVRSAADAARGAELVRAWRPDAIVLDIMMPGTDGLSLIPALRRITEAPILLLSARGDVETRVDGFERGADDYLGKPFSFDELVARLRGALRRPCRPPTLALRVRPVRHAAAPAAPRLHSRTITGPGLGNRKRDDRRQRRALRLVPAREGRHRLRRAVDPHGARRRLLRARRLGDVKGFAQLFARLPGQPEKTPKTVPPPSRDGHTAATKPQPPRGTVA